MWAANEAKARSQRKKILAYKRVSDAKGRLKMFDYSLKHHGHKSCPKYVVVIVLTLTSIIKSAAIGQAPTTLEWKNTPRKNTSKPKACMVSWLPSNATINTISITISIAWVLRFESHVVRTDYLLCSAQNKTNQLLRAPSGVGRHISMLVDEGRSSWNLLAIK